VITIRFVTCHDVVSAAIRAYQYGFWASHVDALIGGKLVGAHFNGGVLARPIGYDASKITKEQIVAIKADDPTTKAFEDFITAQIEKPYDVEAIAAMVLDRDWRDPNSWFCSELIAAGLEQCKIFSRLPAALNRILPRDAMLMATALP
jgi:hypothetical protein